MFIFDKKNFLIKSGATSLKKSSECKKSKRSEEDLPQIYCTLAYPRALSSKQ